MVRFNKGKILKQLSAAVEIIFLALILSLPIYFAFFHEIYNTFNFGQVFILRVLLSLVALFFLAKIFLSGKLIFKCDYRYFIFFGFLAADWLVSASFSQIKEISFWGYYPREQGFFTIIFYLLFLAIIILSLNNLRSLRRLIAAMLGASLVVCFYGIIQLLGLDPIKWSEPGRVFSTFGQPNFFGHFLIIVIPFTVYSALKNRRRFLPASLISILLTAELICLFFTYSRSAWIGLAGEIFLFILFYLFSRGKKRIAFTLIGLTLAIFLASFSFISFAPRAAVTNYSLSNRIKEAFDFSQGTTKIRLETWRTAWQIFKESSLPRKLIGYGPDSYYEQFALHYQSSWALDENIDSWPDRAHNVFFDILLPFGLAGLAVYLLFFIFLIRQGWLFFQKRAHDEYYYLALVCFISLAGYFLNNLFSFSLTAQYFYFYLIIGILIFALSADNVAKEIKIRLTVFSRLIILSAFLLLVAIFIFYYNLLACLADHHYIEASYDIELYNDCYAAVSDNSLAVIMGAPARQYYEAGYISNALSCFNSMPEGGKESLKNILLYYQSDLPDDKFFSYAMRRAALNTLLGRFDSKQNSVADEYFVSLAKKYPEISEVYLDWAKFALSISNYDEAIDIGKKGLENLPLVEMSKKGYFTHRSMIESQEASFDEIIGQAFVGKKDEKNALDYFNKVAELNPYYVTIYKEIADVYQNNKEWDKALWYNNKGYRLDKTNYSWPLAIGNIYKEKGDKVSALDYFQQALSLSPGNQDILDAVSGLSLKAK
jgi:O-antigen ligase